MKSYVQIFGNPDDLQIALGERDDKPGTFGMQISRGPRDERHAFHPIFSTNIETAFTREQALQQLREVLEGAVKIGEDVLFGFHDRETEFAKGLLQVLFNEDGYPKDKYTKEIAPILQQEDIEKIFLCIDRNGIANTYKWYNHWEKRFPGYKKKFHPKMKAS